MVPAATTVTPQAYLQAQSRWHPLEIAFWLATLLPFVLFPNYLSLASQIAITALFALSLDIILGYAGIVSLGHAAFFGIGAYTAGLISKFGWGEPLSGLILAAALAGLVGFAASFIISRFRHFTLIMITLGLGLLAFEAANRAHWLTGGSDGLQGVSGWRYAASAKTGCACRRSAPTAGRISARPTQSPQPLPGLPGRCLRRQQRA